MPTAAPYDSLEDVTNTARVRLNDAIQAIGGDVYTDIQPFTIVFVNAAWRRLQQFLANLGVSALQKEFQWFSVPAVTQTDYGVQVFFNWDTYWDGTADNGAPVLPNDMISPLDLWERIHGTSGTYLPMDQLYNGLPTTPKDVLNRCWEWRDNAVRMPGATGLVDLRLRYSGFLFDFLSNADQPFSTQLVPLVNVLSPFAWFMCAEVAKSRGDLDAGSFEQMAIGEAKLIFDRDVQRGKSLYQRSELGKMVGFNTPLQGPAGPRGPANPPKG